MIEVKKNERNNSLGKLKRLRIDFGLIAGMLKSSLAEGRIKK